MGNGMLILLGVDENDHNEDLEWLVAKCAGMRIFSDAAGQMNIPLAETGGEVTVVSQFTLFASTKKGNRPGFTRSARPEKARTMYETFVNKMMDIFPDRVKQGVFGADMEIELVNDGPVTIIMDTKARE